MRMYAAPTAAVLCLLVGALRASAQQPVQTVFAQCPTGLPLFTEDAVQVPARFVSDTSLRPSPVATRRDSANVVRFVVDTTGRVEPQSLRAVRVTDSAVFRRAQNNIGRWRYEPARASGCRVRQVVTASLSP
jgi:hypothetical protein